MLRLLTRFGLAGVFNSVAGFAVIWLFLLLGASGLAANVAGYAFGLLLSFALNRHYVFGQRGAVSSREVWRFVAAFVTSYLVNLAVLRLAQGWLGDSNPLAQIPAMAAYSVCFFLIARWFVFVSTDRT